MKNVNNPEDMIETDIELNNIKPDKDYQIRVEVENKHKIDDPTNNKKEIINLDIESVDGVKGTYILDGVKNYKHGLFIDNEASSIAESENDNGVSNYSNIKYMDKCNIVCVMLSVG